MEKAKFCVIGAGHGGMAMAGHLGVMGFEVNLFNRSPERIAIALAAQDTIANIIAGFMIMIDSPFRIGDNIKLPSGEPVKVLDIGIRRSKFLSEDNKAIIIVPNLELSKSKIVNFTYGQEKLNRK